MLNITDILNLNLTDEFKSVIDLESRKDDVIQSEIESYIVTEGIARHLSSFLNDYKSNMQETGVWLSGFYGSGKSHFAKMLGYILANPKINGTSAIDRFIPRLKGVSGEELLKNSINGLAPYNSRVIFLDIAKQDTSNGLAFTLFANFLKNLGFKDDIHGYMEFELFINGKYDDFKNAVLKLENQEWNEFKKINQNAISGMRKASLEIGFTENDYQNILNNYGTAIKNFSAGKFKEELSKYLKFEKEERLVFIFDEASEAISTDKFSLLELQGVSEALSGLGSRAWSIAIAQEKLDDVINKPNVNRSQLTKVTDRFKTKIHLESTEVDLIIRNRLLQKTNSGKDKLLDYFKEKKALVADATNLQSLIKETQTTNADDFAEYYPFHRYQFDLMQKFLFSSKALASSQIAERGMIITTVDVLKKQINKMKLFDFTPGYSICAEAQPAPPAELVNKYDSAQKALNKSKSSIDGKELLQVVHLLVDSDFIFPTVANITKSYISDISTYYPQKKIIEHALNTLVDSKVLLLTGSNYKITSDIEEKLLAEMQRLSVGYELKKRNFIKYLKDYKFFDEFAVYTDIGDSFKFSILSDQEDELCGASNKKLQMTVYSPFNIGGNRQDSIDQIKTETQNKNNICTLIPVDSEFEQINKLIEEIIRYEHLAENNAGNSDSDIRQILRDFALIAEDKKKNLKLLVDSAYNNGTLIYLYDEFILDDRTFISNINNIQQKMVKNIYTKRLETQLDDGLVKKIFSVQKNRLNSIFSGKDYIFFDANGTFIGDHLKVVEEISAKIINSPVDGRSLESELSGAPWSYSFGTIVSTLAVLFRAGRLTLKFDEHPYNSYKDKTAQDAFVNTTKFRSADFHRLSEVLSASEKRDAVQLLMDLKFQKHTNRKLDWDDNDFELADGIRMMADHFIVLLESLNDTVKQFKKLFPDVDAQKQILMEFSGKVTENNYIDRVKLLMKKKDGFKSAVETIIAAQKFIKDKFAKVNAYKGFIESVMAELNKAALSDQDVKTDKDNFLKLYNQDMVQNYDQLQNIYQKVKDRYFELIKDAAGKMNSKYQKLVNDVKIARDLLRNYPDAPNNSNLNKIVSLNKYCSERIVTNVDLKNSTTCNNCGFSLSDMLDYISLAATKENELLIIKSSFVSSAPTQVDPAIGQTTDAAQKPRKVILSIPNKIMTVKNYKDLLSDQLKAVANDEPDNHIELEIEI